MGGVGGGIAYNIEEFRELAGRGLDLSPVHEILVEESVIGWKEFELEVMRDVADNFVVICSIENIDPMGVHTGDSITVAPALTLTDKEYQRMRDMARRIIRRVGVETGGSNIQFAINPDDGRIVAIEMNPRVSRSSALASKATGFPIAKIAAKLALGYHLDEIPNDITRLTPASFEPTIDYIVVKFPRWNFEKFPQADRTLTTQMKSVGEAMAIGRTFKEAFLKAVRSLELGKLGSLFPTGPDDTARRGGGRDARCASGWWCRTTAGCGRSSARCGAAGRVETLHELTKIDPLVPAAVRRDRRAAEDGGARRVPRDVVGPAAHAEAHRVQRRRHRRASTASTRSMVRQRRLEEGLVPAYKRIDTCAAEFESFTPYMYGTYEQVCEAEPTPKKKVIILGSGPNRIGQGIEFDYCCCHAVFGFREEGFETVMVNCNPETVSTDYDTADRLYFEPLTFEDVMAIIERERSAGGEVVVRRAVRRPDAAQAGAGAAGGGRRRSSARRPIRSTSPRTASASRSCCGTSACRSRRAARRCRARKRARWPSAIGYPVVVRPSYVLGGRGMAIVFDAGALDRYMTGAVDVSHDRPVLIDRFLEDAFEFDVDAVADATGAVVIGGIMEHIEEAGIHSGDSSCVVPPFMVAERHLGTIREYTRRIARALKVVGLMNIQYAIKDDTVYVLEVNPRSSRTVPYISKATGVPMAKIAARVAAGRTLAELGLVDDLAGGRRVREEPGVPVRPLPGRRHDPRPGDEVDRRGDGRRRQLRRGVRQGDDGRRAAAAGEGLRVHQRQQQRQADRAADRARPGAARVHAGGDARHGGVPARARPRGRGDVQGQRRPAERRRSPRQPRASTWSSTRRSAATRSSTTAPCAARRRWRRCRASRR